jgi:hypothetical protein
VSGQFHVLASLVPLDRRCAGPYGCEMSRFAHFLDSWLTDGCAVVSVMRWPHFTPRKIPGTHFC